MVSQRIKKFPTNKKQPSPQVHQRYLLRSLGQTLLGVVVIMAVICGAQYNGVTGGSTWQKPIPISTRLNQFIDYRTLHRTGDAVYYRIQVAEPSSVRMLISLSRQASKYFAPQVVVYAPYSETIGPIIPVEQPPKTLASLYPMTQTKEVFDAFTQTLTTYRLEAQPIFKSAGTYTFAIYNAGRTAGQYKFTLQRKNSSAEWHDAWQMPKRWWQDQMFAGFSWLSFITPLLIGLSLWLLYLRLDHHQLHVHKSYHKKVPQVLMKKVGGTIQASQIQKPIKRRITKKKT